MDSKNDSNTDKNPSTNLTIRKSKEIGMESVVVVIQHEEQHQSTAYSCQMQWDTFLYTKSKFQVSHSNLIRTFATNQKWPSFNKTKEIK